MYLTLLKSKIHRAIVTGADLHYEGSLTIDSDLMKSAKILPYEMVTVYNINNGERFETYAISGEAKSGVICLNGAAARKGVVGDTIIIACYAMLGENEVKSFKPTIVQVNEKNHVKEII
ncbi:MAG: aspartate 1-decarboxylase [Pseudomonadota bacterium]